MIKFKYFFGSDSRSLPFLSTLHDEISRLKVITLPPKKKGRGRKNTTNPVEVFCIENNIDFDYFDESKHYHDMKFGIVASFSKIFKNSFLENNSELFNIHLSLLPKYRGPTPVETAILNNEIESGYTVFKIDKNIDTGKIIFQNSLNIKNKYASDIYSEIYNLFKSDFSSIDFHTTGLDQDGKTSSTVKFIKNDFNISGSSISEAKNKIRAFDTLGPAFVVFNDKILKVHSYSDVENKSRIELGDGYLFPVDVTPEGKRKMSFDDYLRGLK